MAGGTIICIEIDPNRIQRRIDTKYLDCYTDSLDEALSIAEKSMKKTIYVYRIRNKLLILFLRAKIDFVPDIVTDQTFST